MDNDETASLLPALPAVVLRSIFKLLDYHTLKTCRLVCKEWTIEASAFFKLKSVTIPRHFNGREPKNSLPVQWTDHVQRDKACRSFFVYNLARMDEDYVMPIANIQLEHTFHNNGMQEMLLWLKTNGEKLKSVNYVVNGMSVLSGHVMFYKIRELCPNLEEIVVELETAEYAPELKMFEGLQILPNLKKISVTALYLDRNYLLRLNLWDDPLFSALFRIAPNLQCVDVSANEGTSVAKAIVVASSSCHKLKNITWRNVINEADLQLLVNLKKEVKLETLCLDCELPPLNTIPSMINQILQRHSESLKNVMLFGRLVEMWDSNYGDLSEEEEDEDGDEMEMNGQFREMFKKLGIKNQVPNIPMNEREFLPFFALQVPILPKVTNLQLSDIFHLRIQGSLSSFLKNFPVLKRLSMDNLSYAWNVHPLTPDQVLHRLLTWDANEDQAHERLEEFYLDGEIIESNAVTSIVNTLPRLKKLKLQVQTDDVFCHTLEAFVKKLKLSELDLTVRSITDMGWCNNIMTLCFPKMTDLKNLQLVYCSTSGTFGEYPFRFVENTIINGFCNAPSLRWLKLTNFSFCSTTKDKSIERLRAHCFSLTLKHCVCYSPVFNETYDPWHQIRSSDQLAINSPSNVDKTDY